MIFIINFLIQQPSEEYLTLLEPTVALSITYDQLQILYCNFPGFNYTGRLLIEWYCVLSEQRASHLSSRMTSRILQIAAATLSHRVSAAVQHIASHLGTASGTRSRLFLARTSYSKLEATGRTHLNHPGTGHQFCTLLVVIVAGLNWEKQLSTYSILHLSRHIPTWREACWPISWPHSCFTGAAAGGTPSIFCVHHLLRFRPAQKEAAAGYATPQRRA